MGWAGHWGGTRVPWAQQCPVFPSPAPRLPVLVSWGFCNKWPQTGLLKTTGMCPPIVAAARSLKSRCWRAGPRSLRRLQGTLLPFPASSGTRRPSMSACLHMASSLCVWVKPPPPLSYKDTCHWVETLSPGCSHLATLNYTCKDPFSRCGLIDRCQAWTPLSGAGHNSPHLAVPFGQPLWDLNLHEIEDQQRAMGK